MFISIISLVCLAFLLCLVLFVLGKIIFRWRRNRQEGIAYIRGFKKGECAIVYMPAIVLYWMGICYSGEAFFGGLFDAIAKVVGLVVLKYDIECIAGLLQVNGWYRAAVYTCFTLVLLNAFLFTLSWSIQGIWSGWQKLRERYTRKKRLILIGNNPENVAIYQSDGQYSKMILEEISAGDKKHIKKEKEMLYMNKAAFCFTYALDAEIKKRVRWSRKHQKECVIVVNTHDDKKNITICKAIVDDIVSLPKEQQEETFTSLKVFVFGEPRYETIYADVVQSGLGCIHFVNKHLKIAMDFIDKYPFTRFMDEKQIDYETSLIKEGVDINAMFIGFGKTNQQIFLTSVANNQFLTGSEAAPKLKKVKYFIFDKDPAENNKNLNHSYYRYKNECCDAEGKFILNKEDYLPPPALPAEEEFWHLNVNDRDFYKQIKSVVTKNENDANFVIIAFGSDLENLDMAQKLVEKRREWGLKNLVIFVKIRDWKKEQSLLENEGCYFIGHEQEVVYNIEKITNDKIYCMSRARDLFYELAKRKKSNTEGKSDEELRAEVSREWHEAKDQIQRESSLYCCLSLRSKLNLMGLDYCPVEENSLEGYDQTRFWAHIACDDMPNNCGSEEQPDITYSFEFKQSRRKTMAIHEHQRWNSFMISKGIIPASRDQIVTEKIYDPDQDREKHSNGKNYAMRRHGNLTTFDGLVEFRQIIAKRDDKPEKEKDVIQYDYQILDDAHWLLKEQGYKIVNQKELQAAKNERRR